MTTIKLKNGSGAPTAGDLAQGEPALDLTNKRLYTEDSGGTVIEVGTNPTSVTTGDITATGTATFAGLTTTADVSFGDNDKAIFGAGSDLQIYHDGSNSFIDDQGTGSLVLQSNGAFTLIQNSSGVANARFDSAGAASLRYNGAEKLATTSTGVDVTGTVTADGLTVDSTLITIGSGGATNQATELRLEGTSNAGNGSYIRGRRDGSSSFLIGDTAGALGSGTGVINYVYDSNPWSVYTNANERLTVEGNGDISFYEDTGTTAKFFWDASAEYLGIGTTSPWETLSIPFNNKLSLGSSAYAFSISRDSAGELVTTFEDTYNSSSARIDFKMRNGAVTPLSLLGSGNVGIGTTSPSATGLHISQNNANAELTLQRTGTFTGNFKIYSGGGSTNRLVFRDMDASSDRMTLDASGNLLVGTTSGTGYKIRSVATGSDRSMLLQCPNGGANVVTLNTSGTADYSAFLFTTDGGNTQTGSIVVGASSTTYNTSSDQRLKDNIVDAPSASDDIDAIQVRSFDWKADGSHQKYGMVAQELQSVAPEAVTGDANSDDMMGVDYSKLVPMLVKEIQSLRARVAQLEND